MFAGAKLAMPLLTLVAAALINACGSGREVQESSSKTADPNAAIPCEKKSCPKINLSINATPLQNGKLVATLAGGENWMINGIAQGGGTRDIRMQAYNPPVGGSFIGQGSLQIKADYKASDVAQSQTPIHVVIRDVSRCEHEKPDQAASCQNMDQKGLESYEAQADFPWEVTLGNIDDITDPSFTAGQEPMYGANAGMQGCVQGGMAGMMGGMGGGGIMKAFMGGAMGCMQNSMQNLQNK